MPGPAFSFFVCQHLKSRFCCGKIYQANGICSWHFGNFYYLYMFIVKFIQMKTKIIAVSALVLAIIIGFGCRKEKPVDTSKPSGNLVFKFAHRVNGENLEIDTLKYTNAAGNEYMVNEIQYFVSDVTLHRSDGSSLMIKAWDDIYYVDTDIPSTWTWNVYDSIIAGDYTSISLVFGITQAKNFSYMYLNPPERDMFWPEFLGGGYHYLKLNGKWKNTSDLVVPFDFHLGIGQIYASNVVVVDSIIGFVQNYFTVTLPNSAFSIADGETREIEIVMNVERWFETPHVWDHDVLGSYIMQNQDAMQIAKENGFDVFTIGYIQ
jgi:hypothetical protein